MKTQKIALGLTIINLIIMIVVITKVNPATAQQRQNELKVIRARGLEIIDSMGRIRASITLQPAVTQDGKFYPEGILLRLIDTKGQPSVKIGAAENGGGISLSNESQGYIQILSKEEGGFIKIKNADGKEKVFQP
jgi:hypothetical protein